MTQLGFVAAGVGTGLAFLFNRQIIAPAAAAEQAMLRMQTNLGSLGAGGTAARYGDASRAFAARTGLSRREALGGFAAGAAVGVDPSILADAAREAAAGAGVTFAQAMAAMSGAARGEAGALSALGIQAEVSNNQLVVTWEQFGRQYRNVINLANRSRAAARLAETVSRRFAGAAERQSETWDGMTRQLRASWEDFTDAIADAGVFDWLKAQLFSVNQWVRENLANGNIARWARDVGTWITEAFGALRTFVLGYELVADDGSVLRQASAWERLRAVFQTIDDALKPITSRLGWTNTILLAIGAITFGPLIGAISGIGLALLALMPAILKVGAALLLTPIGWVALGLAAIAGAAILIYENWEPIRAFFEDLWGGIEDAVRRAMAVVQSFLNMTPPGFTQGPDRDPNNLQPRRGGGTARRLYDPLPDLPPAGSVPGFNPAAMRVDAGGQIRITLDDQRATASGRMNDLRFGLDLSQGFAVATP
jgi:phage tail tape-measure protein